VDRDLIIVGGGPVGASLARAAHGLSVALLAHERRVSAPRKERFDARVYALSPANVAFLGLELDRLSPVHAMRVYGDGDSRIEFDAYRAGVAALAYIVEDSALQDALWEGLEPVVGRCEGLEVDEARAVVFVPHLVQPCVSHNDKQPRLQVFFDVGPVWGPGSAQISFLHQILSFGRVARQSQRIPVERVDMFHRRLAESGAFRGAFHHLPLWWPPF